MTDPPLSADFPANTPGSEDWFVALLAPTQMRLYRYVATLVPGRADAEDVFQKTLLTAWQERAKFDRNRDFFSWLCGVARNHVRHHARSAARSRAVLAPDVLEQLADRLVEEDDYFEHRQAALARCLDRLPAKTRDLVRRFYQTDRTIKEFAIEIGSGAEAVYKSLQRIRSALHECVTETLARETGR